MYEDARRYTGPRLWWLRARHVVLNHVDLQLHRWLWRYNVADAYELWRCCDHVDELFLERLMHDPGFEDHLAAVGRLTPFITEERA